MNVIPLQGDIMHSSPRICRRVCQQNSIEGCEEWIAEFIMLIFLLYPVHLFVYDHVVM